jgi:hypothetical protein
MIQPSHPPLFDHPVIISQEHDYTLPSSTACSFLKSLVPSTFQCFSLIRHCIKISLNLQLPLLDIFLFQVYLVTTDAGGRHGTYTLSIDNISIMYLRSVKCFHCCLNLHDSNKFQQ